MAEAKLNGVTKTFGTTVAVDRLDLRIGDGEFLVMLGPTGAGKTTTLRLLAGLELPDQGRIEIDGRDMTATTPADRDVAFVFQQYSLYPHYTVYDNLAFPLRARCRRLPEDVIKKRVQEIAELLRIAHKLGNRSTELSGGEMQRVSIGRALVRAPKLFLMDEPLSSLDAKLREDLRLELKRIQSDLGATIVYVTHDQQEAMTLADRIGILDQGRLAQIGTPAEIYRQPASIYAAQRLGSPKINLLPATRFADDATPSGAAWAGIRPEAVQLDASGDVLAAVLAVEHLGAETVALVEADGLAIHALIDPSTAIAEGTQIGLSIPIEALIWFDAQGQRINH